MAAQLLQRTKEQQRSVIRFLWSEGVKTGEIYGRMTVQYGDNCRGQSKVLEWVGRFKGGQTNVEARFERPWTVTC